MRTFYLSRLLTLFVFIVAASRCGSSTPPTTPSAPSAPSSSGGAGATIAGTVQGAAASAPAGLTVAVAGTSLSAPVEAAGNFQISAVPAGNVQLQFKSASATATAPITNVGNGEWIQIQVQLTGSSATILSETRSASNEKVSLCHRTESGTYQSIEVGVTAEPAHRAHGDGKVGEQVPGDTTKVFGPNCQPTGPSVRIKKSTNGQDADEAPGPTLAVGSQVTWTYVVTNTGTVPLTGVAVVDNPNGPVACPKSSLATGESMTCTATGTAIAGQYRNVGTVTASWTSGTVTNSDASHYFGQSVSEDTGPKVQLCHRTGNGSYHLIEVSVSAEPSHRAHGDGKVGDAVPGSPGKVFSASCTVQ
jgi:uncharacterized repeat protein (TIGR01451 family)